MGFPLVLNPQLHAPSSSFRNTWWQPSCYIIVFAHNRPKIIYDQKFLLFSNNKSINTFIWGHGVDRYIVVLQQWSRLIVFVILLYVCLAVDGDLLSGREEKGYFEKNIPTEGIGFDTTGFPTVCIFHLTPSVPWCCWFGGRKGIRPVKNWVVGWWRGYLSGARCWLAYGPADATATHCLLLQ